MFSFDGTIKDNIVSVTITTLEIDEHENFIYLSTSSAVLKINSEGYFGNLDFTEGYKLYKK
ncbi:MAG: hypothetical protein HZB41_07315 [Ignavibacteriae bacterium]|nr:hypothetical protein [Ignavibacteriota bacterium]